ncbi:hypothetical protein BCR43DRAFT_484802 [Syncephalastrum racemosum]|uniref:Uncharacterized protein n=1 Tax=Syncephalastrum racemosum TaxID=13706 RepID=A0A1X2HLD1_SYNRA|nr:hypothetical protein BCR43DRAFT_484802 [Syncephalastrum racemosum]
MSPPPLSLNGSRRLSHNNSSRYAPSSPSLISTSTTTHNEVPMTPEIYPAHYRHYSISSHHSKKSNPQSHSQHQHKPLLLQSPPLPSRPVPLSRTTTASYHDDSIKTDDEHRSSRQETASPTSETAVENLQTEVTALSEQIEKLRRGMAADDARRRTSKRVLALWFVKTLVKHAVVNSIILLIAFAILWHRRSPMADIVLAYAKPRLQRFMRLLLSRVVLWRVTV